MKLEKAYQNDEFLLGTSARPIRILSEYLEPQTRFEALSIEDTIVIMGSARFVDRERAELEYEQAIKQNSGIAEAKRRLSTSRYYEEARQLAFRLTKWSNSLKSDGRRFVVCTGGGPGIMEAANRGAKEAEGMSVGLAISLPMEEENVYISRELAFQFHYFFMRKFWFVYLAKAVILFPGGFGTLDELFETLTLLQTGKIKKPLPIVLYGSDYWERVVDFDALIDYGSINRKDIDLFMISDSVDETFQYITQQLAITV